MWWSRALLAVALLAMGPAGCGFRPLYGKASAAAESAVAAELSSVRVRAIEDRQGQQLRNSLVQRLTPAGEPAHARYELVVKLTKSLEGLGQQKDARSTLGRMRVTADFSLIEPGTEDTVNGQPVSGLMSGTAGSVVSFNYLGARYASVTMERDAEERAIEELSESIRTQLAVHFAKTKRAGDR